MPFDQALTKIRNAYVEARRFALLMAAVVVVLVGMGLVLGRVVVQGDARTHRSVCFYKLQAQYYRQQGMADVATDYASKLEIQGKIDQIADKLDSGDLCHG